MASKKTEWKRLERARKRVKGECYDCKHPAHYDSTRCLKHLDLNARKEAEWKARNAKQVREYNQKKKARHKEEGRCTACGCQLDEYDSLTKCMNCNQRIYNEDYKPHLAKRL